MPNYGSLPNGRNHNIEIHDERPEATERSSLLPRRTEYLSASPSRGALIEDDRVTINTILEEEAVAFLPLLTKSMTPVGPTAEPILALAIEPDENGDLRLPRDESLGYMAKDDDDEETGEFRFHGGVSSYQFWMIFAGIMSANFVAAFDGTIMASTHTSITSSFNASELASWLSTSFLLTATSFQPLYGRISDVVGRKGPFVFSCFVFTAATLWCALAPDIMSFIAARAVCGFGAGGMVTMGAIVLSDLCPLEVRGTYQSINNLAWGVGGVLGAASGGALADYFGWRWSFGLQVPFGIFCMIVLYCTIPDRTDPGASASTLWERFKDFDFMGSFFLTTSLTFLILAMNLGGNIFPWSDWRVILALVIGVVMFVLLLRVEMRTVSPVMPLRLLRSSRGLVVFNNFLNNAMVNAVIFNLPLYFQGVRLESAAQAGGRLLIPALTSTFSGVATGLIITRLQRLDVTFYAGEILMLIGSVLLTLMPRDLPYWGYFLFLVPCHLGNGFVMPSSLMSTLTMSTQADQAVATSTLIMWRSLGGVLGIASSSLIVQNFLAVFLKAEITGPNKEELIEKVRKNVQSIFDLDPAVQAQVTKSYEAALRICFVYIAVAMLISALLVVKVSFPVLPGRRKGGKEGGVSR
ncbi:major facilitator superfamily transporter [Sphaerosporella brunnea]|uniref:Major facilitator superfamily transporter n=1 Tax=Sphaerosporella brunnea TaxID=1250544 RepID=A0A5J5EU18_9PEZI|nr:major facilitator superfamily transporter [Sphaerosporella brunnea]